MRLISRSLGWSVVLGCAGLIGPGPAARAFPPTPHHVIHGTVRNEIGDPLSLASAKVVLETPGGTRITCQVMRDVLPGENYRLVVPMDSGTAQDVRNYKPNALQSTVPFRLKVQVGTTTYVPLEMAGNLATLGRPGESTLLNLTLGVDSDQDGLPDSWEQAMIELLGGGKTLADITPQGDALGEGMSNYDRFLLGSSGLTRKEALTLAVNRQGVKGPVIEFYATQAGAYSMLGTTNFHDWSPVTFRAPAGFDGAPSVQEYNVTAGQIIAFEVVLPDPAPAATFYRMQVR